MSPIFTAGLAGPAARLVLASKQLFYARFSVHPRYRNRRPVARRHRPALAATAGHRGRVGGWTDADEDHPPADGGSRRSPAAFRAGRGREPQPDDALARDLHLGRGATVDALQ